METIASSLNENPGDVEIDLGAGKLFFSHGGLAGNGTISSADLDGSNMQLVATTTGWPFHLTLDPGNEHVYWTDWLASKIMRSTLQMLLGLFTLALLACRRRLA